MKEIGVVRESLVVTLSQQCGFLEGDVTPAERLLRHLADPLRQDAAVVLDVGEDLGDAVPFDEVFDGIPLVPVQSDMDRVGIAEKVVEVAQDLLIGTDEEDGEKIGRAVP